MQFFYTYLYSVPFFFFDNDDDCHPLHIFSVFENIFLLYLLMLSSIKLMDYLITFESSSYSNYYPSACVDGI